MRTLIFTFCFAAFTASLGAQVAEIGAGFGGSFYTGREVKNAGQTVDAGFQAGFAGSVWVTHNNMERFGGEIRYTYARNTAELSGRGASATFGAESHMVGYDVLFYTKDRRHRVRPYFFGGAGVKYFRGTGTERAQQPLSQFAFLTRTNETKPYVDFGAGVKWQINPKLGFRVEVRDVVSPFPKEIIAPAGGSSIGGGWTHNIIPMIGFSYLF